MAEHSTGTAKVATSFVRGGTIRVRLTENVTTDNLNNLIARIGSMTGCTHCGLLGVDLALLGPDPVEGELGKLPGVANVSIGD